MKILLAEDEVQMSNAEAAFLKMKGFEVDAAFDGEEALEKALRDAYDVLVLDVMMPKADGIQVLRALRGRGDVTPVIMLTAKAEVDDRVEGLSAGADDYLTKPFALRELEARIRAQIRRSEQFASGPMTYRGLTLNADELSCRSAVRLAAREAQLMAYLMRNAERALPAEELLRQVWRDQPEAGGEAVYLYISYLRRKLEAVSADAEIRGGTDGYILRGIGDAP